MEKTKTLHGVFVIVLPAARGEEEEIRNYGESVLTAAGSRLLICGHFSLQTSHHDYFLGEKINEQEENQSDRDEHKKRSHTGLNYQMKYLHG